MTTDSKTIHNKLNDLVRNLISGPESAFKRVLLWQACELIADYCMWHRMADSEPKWGVPVFVRYTDDGDDEMPEVAWSDARDGSWGDRVPRYWLYIPALTLTQPQAK